jgi:copper chaperone
VDHATDKTEELLPMSSTASYTVVGMTCNGCVTKVTTAVTRVEGVEDTDVDVSTGLLEVVGTADEAAIREAVAKAGYEIADSTER